MLHLCLAPKTKSGVTVWPSSLAFQTYIDPFLLERMQWRWGDSLLQENFLFILPSKVKFERYVYSQRHRPTPRETKDTYSRGVRKDLLIVSDSQKPVTTFSLEVSWPEIMVLDTGRIRNVTNRSVFKPHWHISSIAIPLKVWLGFKRYKSSY